METLTNFTKFLQACITPVALISGVGLLLLTITNRIGRVIDRVRHLVVELDNSHDLELPYYTSDPDNEPFGNRPETYRLFTVHYFDTFVVRIAYLFLQGCFTVFTCGETGGIGVY